jgi:Uma2 family endonuclease
MRQSALHRLSADEFLEWDLPQPDGRHELIDGVPVAMTGVKRHHDSIVVNTVVALRTRLRNGPCQPLTADIAVLIPSGNVRRPDVTVQCEPLQCGPFNEAATHTENPVVLIELLSLSTRPFDLARKLEEYKSVADLRHILLIDSDFAEVIVWPGSGSCCISPIFTMLSTSPRPRQQRARPECA